jgi:hypothetical protein
MLVISRVNQHVMASIAGLIHAEKLAEATVSCLGLHDAANGAESIHYMRPLAVRKPLRTRATIAEGCLSSTSGGVLPILSVSVQPDGS